MSSTGQHVLEGSKVSIVSRVLVSVVILGISLGIFRTLVALKPPAPKVDRPPAAMSVRVVSATVVRTPRSWRGYGTALAKESADVAAEAAGAVIARSPDIEVGRWVEKGGVIVEIDAREYSDRAARSRELIASLEADLRGLDVELESQQEMVRLADQSADLTRRELERIRGAVEAGSANRFELEALEDRLARVLRERESMNQGLTLIPTRKARTKAQLDAEKANLRLAELDVSRCRVASPISGVLQAVDVEIGERVTVNERVARVVDLSVIELPLRMPVASASWVHVGDRVVVDVGAGGSDSWDGTVVRIAPEADPATRSITVYAEIEQKRAAAEAANAPGVGALLLPGQFVFGRIESTEQIERIAVPRGSVSGDRVFVISADGVVSTRVVTIAFAAEGVHPDVHPDETQWFILDHGLEPGERIAVSNIADLRAGMIVEGIDAARAVAGDARGAGRAGGNGP